MYKAKLVGETDAQPAPNNKKILKNAIIAVPKKYLSNFWRSLEMWLINCKVELKLKWTKHCVLATAGVTMLILILIISFLLSKTYNHMFLSSLYQQKTTKTIKTPTQRIWNIVLEWI